MHLTQFWQWTVSKPEYPVDYSWLIGLMRRTGLSRVSGVLTFDPQDFDWMTPCWCTSRVLQIGRKLVTDAVNALAQAFA